MRWIAQGLQHGWHRLLRVSGNEPLLLLILLLLAAALWTFADLADEVIEGDTEAFDLAVLLAMRTPGNLTDPWGPRWLEEFGRDVTALGSSGILTLVTLAVIGFLLLQGKRRVAVMVVIAVGGGMLLSTGMKELLPGPAPRSSSLSSSLVVRASPAGMRCSPRSSI